MTHAESLNHDRPVSIVIEFPCAGTTYRQEAFGVYEYARYPQGSVLHGQEKRTFLGSFATLAAAREAHPAARVSKNAALAGTL